MKKAALLFAVLGSIFFAGCATQEESATVETTEEVTTPDGDTQQTSVEESVTTTVE